MISYRVQGSNHEPYLQGLKITMILKRRDLLANWRIGE